MLDHLFGKLQSAADAQGDAEEKKDGMRLTECICNRKTLWWLRLCLTCKAGKVY